MKTEYACAYLPYGLKGAESANSYVFRLKSVSSDGNCLWKVSFEDVPRPMGSVLPRTDCKPILRPLSDLTKEITNDGETFVPIETLFYPLYSKENENQKAAMLDYSIQSITTSSVFDINQIGYNKMQALLSWRFDVFNLIESGEAIDVNTLEKKPYE